MLSVAFFIVMLSVIMVSVVKLNVVMLSIVAPWHNLNQKVRAQCDKNDVKVANLVTLKSWS